MPSFTSQHRTRARTIFSPIGLVPFVAPELVYTAPASVSG